jgi:hypothetical protein
MRHHGRSQDRLGRSELAEVERGAATVDDIDLDVT